jgi:hypothetical protein
MGIIRRKTGEESPQRFQQTRHIEMGALLMRARRSQENPTRKTPASCRPAGEPEDDDLSGDG